MVDYQLWYPQFSTSDILLIVRMVSGSRWPPLSGPRLKRPLRVTNFIRPSGKTFSSSAADGYEYFFLIWKQHQIFALIMLLWHSKAKSQVYLTGSLIYNTTDHNFEIHLYFFLDQFEERKAFLRKMWLLSPHVFLDKLLDLQCMKS